MSWSNIFGTIEHMFWMSFDKFRFKGDVNLWLISNKNLTDCIVTAYTYVYVINTEEVIKLLLYVQFYGRVVTNTIPTNCARYVSQEYMKYIVHLRHLNVTLEQIAQFPLIVGAYGPINKPKTNVDSRVLPIKTKKAFYLFFANIVENIDRIVLKTICREFKNLYFNSI